MKECIKVKGLLSRYLDKETSSADTALVKEHLDICPLCKKELLELSRVKEIILGKEKKALPRDYLVCRLREEIAEKQGSESRPKLADIGTLSRRFIPVPAATLVLSAALLFTTSTGQKVSEASLEDNMLKGVPVTTEVALGLILGVEGQKDGGD
jgi:predicted anti-sigma-YlaC factor YlaD